MKNSSNRPDNRSGTQKLTHESGPGMSLAHLALFATLIGNMFLIPMALFAMTQASGPLENLKLLIVGLGASAAAYAVNRFAVDRLAPLAAIGFKLAGAFAITIILITGSATFLGSLTGIIYGSVEVKTYQENGQELTQYIGSVNEAALVATRVAPAVQAIAGDIERTASCEVSSSCLSRRGNGGRGSMSIALEAAAAKAFAIVEALEAGALDRSQLLDELNRLNERYNAELADTDQPMSQRRAAMQSIHAEISQMASALSEALPISLIKGFAQELRAGASVRGNPSGSRILSAYLRDHGSALADQLDGLPDAELIAPNFPERPGMLDVLGYLADFAAIAAIVFVGELCLPITLYVMTWLMLVWEIEKRSKPRKAEPEDDGFSGLIDPPEGK